MEWVEGSRNTAVRGRRREELQFRALCARTDWPPHHPRNRSGPETRGRPGDTSTARPASGRATPATRSGHANHPPAVPVFRKLDALAVLTGPLLLAPLLCPEFPRTQGSVTGSCGVFVRYGRIRPMGSCGRRADAVVLPRDWGPAGVLPAPAAR